MFFRSKKKITKQELCNLVYSYLRNRPDTAIMVYEMSKMWSVDPSRILEVCFLLEERGLIVRSASLEYTVKLCNEGNLSG